MQKLLPKSQSIETRLISIESQPTHIRKGNHNISKMITTQTTTTKKAGTEQDMDLADVKHDKHQYEDKHSQ